MDAQNIAPPTMDDTVLISALHRMLRHSTVRLARNSATPLPTHQVALLPARAARLLSGQYRCWFRIMSRQEGGTDGGNETIYSPKMCSVLLWRRDKSSTPASGTIQEHLQTGLRPESQVLFAFCLNWIEREKTGVDSAVGLAQPCSCRG